MTIQNGLIILGAVILLLIIAGYGALHLFYGSIYRFDQTADGPEKYNLDGVREVTFASEDGQRVAAWIKPPTGNAPVILYFMGNFTSIGPSVGRLAPFLDQGYGLAALVYRGSSGQDGTPSEENFAADARALYDQLDALMGTPVPSQSRIAHGYSLGSGIAVRLATERQIAALTLEAAYARFCDYFTDRYYGLPFCCLMTRERYDSMDRIARINAPLIQFHGEQDSAISMASGERLFEAAVQPKEFHAYPQGTHVNLGEAGLYRDAVAFYRTHVTHGRLTD
ncbi:MAG: hypothetical protein CMN55_09445 [Sneathiella sp.]|jgi:dipeptidyl aminopeptidase/acylaminoacyl peptidase|uniref:alpha/beta hydrolase n=1 Tax=Sneathiella sp. TaxID=1964365 RepID=UPI000C4B7720|nr:hypothetical protein [Sneathiella sp.]MAL79320.1 hypothetical protein [Sneathiella sp.]